MQMHRVIVSYNFHCVKFPQKYGSVIVYRFVFGGIGIFIIGCKPERKKTLTYGVFHVESNML